MNRYTFKLGDIVYYMSPIAEFSVKRARKKSVDSSLNGAKIALANIQQRIKKLERIQRLLKENNK